MLDAEAFPGWENFAAMVAHLRFVRDHHQKIEKVAVVSDSTFLGVAPRFASHFVQAAIRHCSQTDREAALAWLLGNKSLPVSGEVHSHLVGHLSETRSTRSNSPAACG